MPIPILFNYFQKLQVRFVGPGFRRLGQFLHRNGVKIAGNTNGNISLMPNPNQISSNTKSPDLANFTFIGTNTHLIGSVRSGKNSQVYFNSNLKTSGEKSQIEIGTNVIILDLVTIRADDDKSVIIGDGAMISSNSYLHNCQVGKNGFVGPGASVGEDCVLSEHSGLAAGGKLLAGSNIPTNEFWAGNPAQFLRKILPEEHEYIADLKMHYYKLGEVYLEETNKSQGLIVLNNLYREDLVEEEGLEIPHEHFEEFVGPFMDAKLGLTTDDINHSDLRSDRALSFEEGRYEHKEMLYDGNKKDNPSFLNERNVNYKQANEIKENLENDLETKRIKKEVFEKSRVNLNDHEFNRKY